MVRDVKAEQVYRKQEGVVKFKKLLAVGTLPELELAHLIANTCC